MKGEFLGWYGCIWVKKKKQRTFLSGFVSLLLNELIYVAFLDSCIQSFICLVHMWITCTCFVIVFMKTALTLFKRLHVQLMHTCWERWRSSILSRRIWASLSLNSNIIALFHWSSALPRPSLSSSVRVWDRLTLSIFIPSMLFSSSFCRASNSMASSSRIRYTNMPPSIIDLIHLVIRWSNKSRRNEHGCDSVTEDVLWCRAHMQIRTKHDKTWLAHDHIECECLL